MSDLNKEIQDKVYHAFKSINSQMEAHLIESIISLFHQGVLKHYVRNPRHNLNPVNFNMSIDAANGVKFEGREKIIEQDKEIQSLKEKLKQYESGHKGACSTCEVVGELNIELEKELADYKRVHGDWLTQNNQTKGE